MKKHSLTLSIAVLAFLSSLAQTTAKDWFDKGVSEKKNEKYDDAITSFKKAVALETTYADAWHQLGWCYNEEGLYNEALDALKKEEMNGSSDKASNNFEMGYAYKGLKNYDDALTRFNKAIELDPNYAFAYKERGNTNFKKADYTNALDDYNKYESMTDNIQDAVFYYDKGWCENELKKYSEAVSSLTKSVQLDNKYSDAYTELGYSYYELNLNDESINNYRIAVALSNEADYLPLLGMADVYYDNLKNYDSALVYYEKGTRIQKKNKTAFYRLGWCYNDRDRFSDAIEPLQEAILLDDEFDNARTELGYAYYKLKQYDNALAQFRPVMSRNVNDELSRYYAGFCYYLLNDTQNLKKMIDELKTINTSNSLKYADTLTKYIK